jgi:hypothetical protein
MGDGGTRTAASVADLAEEGEVPEAAGLRQFDLVRLLHRVGGEGVDLAGRDPGVVEGGQDRTAGEGALVLGEPLGEGCLAYADDGGGVLEAARSCCHAAAPPGPNGR